MPELVRPDGVIHYEVAGSGFPVLLFAPGGLRSSIPFWSASASGPPRPWVDWYRALPAAGFTAIAMDQRNAGRSCADIASDHGWHTYAADHIALMDHLGFGRYHVLGGCIGGSFCLKAIEQAPDRVVSAVLQNPIGLHPEHPDYFPQHHAEWGSELRAARPQLDESALADFGRNMWDGEFVFSVDRDFVRHCLTPALILPGNDIPHPAVTSAELERLLPRAEVLRDWRGPTHLREQETAVIAFLVKRTPSQGQTGGMRSAA